MSELAIARPKLLIPTVPLEIPASYLFKKKDDWKRWLEHIFLMSGTKSNYASGKQIGRLCGAATFNTPTHEYVGLWTAALSDTSTGSTGSEAAYTSYARTEIGTGNNQSDAWNAPTGTTTSTVTNFGNINFPTSTGSSSTVTYMGILDASSTGNMLFWTDVTSVTINVGETPQIAAGAISIVED